MELSSLPPVTKPPEKFSLPHRPLMLKDYLRYDTSSSDGFRAFPRRATTATVRSLLELDLGSATGPKLVRSRSKAASAAINKLQRASTLLLNAVKFIQHKHQYPAEADDHKPCFLPRSLSRRLGRCLRSKSEKSRKQDDNLMTVTVKDIMRWKSFSEANFSEIKTPNYMSSPVHASTTSATDRSSTWSSSTWSESDFSLEFGSSCSSGCLMEQNAGDSRKRSPARKERRKEKKDVGEDEEESCVVTAATYYRKPKVKGEKRGAETTYEEKEQLSPVSVLDFPDEDGDSPSSSSSAFHQSLVTMERAKKKFLQRIRRFESLAEFEPVDLDSRLAESGLDSPATRSDCSCGEGDGGAAEEARARELIVRLLTDEILVVDTTQLTELDEKMMLDFFREGLEGGERSEVELAAAAREWVAGSGGGRDGRWGVDDMRESHVREMEAGGRWRKFREEEEVVAAALADGVTVALMEELLIDILC